MKKLHTPLLRLALSGLIAIGVCSTVGPRAVQADDVKRLEPGTVVQIKLFSDPLWLGEMIVIVHESTPTLTTGLSCPGGGPPLAGVGKAIALQSLAGEVNGYTNRWADGPEDLWFGSTIYLPPNTRLLFEARSGWPDICDPSTPEGAECTCTGGGGIVRTATVL